MLPGCSRPFLGADGFYPSYGRWWASSSWRCSGLFLASCSTIRRPGDPPAFHLVARLIVSISSAHSPRLPPLFLALLADLAGRASIAWGLTRPRHPRRHPPPVLPQPRLPACLLRTEQEQRSLRFSRRRGDRLRASRFLSFRNDLTRGFHSLFSGHASTYAGSGGELEISISPCCSVGRAQWWARQGSNLQPSASKADALSIGLRGQGRCGSKAKRPRLTAQGV